MIGRPSTTTCRLRTRALLLAATLGTARAAAVADDAAGATDGDAAVPRASDAPADLRTGRARFVDPEDGALDLSYFLENPRGFLPVPIIITEPAVGYGGGGAGLFPRPRREAGEEGFARPDISAVGAFATQNGSRGNGWFRP